MEAKNISMFFGMSTILFSISLQVFQDVTAKANEYAKNRYELQKGKKSARIVLIGVSYSFPKRLKRVLGGGADET